MPHPAIDKLKQAATVVVAAGDKAVRLAAPVVRRAVAEVQARVRRPDDVTPTGPTGLTGPTGPTPGAPGAAVAAEAPAAKPSPASIAKNVPHQRPVAKPAAAARPKPDDVPGGKLPPRR